MCVCTFHAPFFCTVVVRRCAKKVSFMIIRLCPVVLQCHHLNTHTRSRDTRALMAVVPSGAEDLLRYVAQISDAEIDTQKNDIFKKIVALDTETPEGREIVKDILTFLFQRVISVGNVQSFINTGINANPSEAMKFLFLEVACTFGYKNACGLVDGVPGLNPLGALTPIKRQPVQPGIGLPTLRVDGVGEIDAEATRAQLRGNRAALASAEATLASVRRADQVPRISIPETHADAIAQEARVRRLGGRRLSTTQWVFFQRHPGALERHKKRWYEKLSAVLLPEDARKDEIDRFRDALKDYVDDATNGFTKEIVGVLKNKIDSTEPESVDISDSLEAELKGVLERIEPTYEELVEELNGYVDDTLALMADDNAVLNDPGLTDRYASRLALLRAWHFRFESEDAETKWIANVKAKFTAARHTGTLIVDTFLNRVRQIWGSPRTTPELRDADILEQWKVFIRTLDVDAFKRVWSQTVLDNFVEDVVTAWTTGTGAQGDMTADQVIAQVRDVFKVPEIPDVTESVYGDFLTEQVFLAEPISEPPPGVPLHTLLELDVERARRVVAETKRPIYRTRTVTLGMGAPGQSELTASFDEEHAWRNDPYNLFENVTQWNRTVVFEWYSTREPLRARTPVSSGRQPASAAPGIGEPYKAPRAGYTLVHVERKTAAKGDARTQYTSTLAIDNAMYNLGTYRCVVTFLKDDRVVVARGISETAVVVARRLCVRCFTMYTDTESGTADGRPCQWSWRTRPRPETSEWLELAKKRLGDAKALVEATKPLGALEQLNAGGAKSTWLLRKEENARADAHRRALVELNEARTGLEAAQHAINVVATPGPAGDFVGVHSAVKPWPDLAGDHRDGDVPPSTRLHWGVDFAALGTRAQQQQPNKTAKAKVDATYNVALLSMNPGRI